MCTPVPGKALVIGAGPAGLMAAEQLGLAGHKVTIVDAKPSVGRKFLMAGKSGLNLTKAQNFDSFVETYGSAAPWLKPILEQFGPDEVQDWATGLGQTLFTGSTGRIFPTVMKASPLLRAWLTRLSDLGVTVETNWRFEGLVSGGARFTTPDGPLDFEADAIVLALGGASWARLGSDGAWADWLDADLAPFQPTNVGLCVNWSDHMQPFLGHPIKGAALHAGSTVSRGEFAISSNGIEGGGVYLISHLVRDSAPLTLDLFPDKTVEDIAARLAKPRGKTSYANHLRKALRLQGARKALVQEWVRPMPYDPLEAANTLKALPVPHEGPRPMDEAISTAGGIAQSGLTGGLMLKNRPGVFAAGEMLDWEAPTGGYLLTACLATGHWAGRHAAGYLSDAAPA